MATTLRFAVTDDDLNALVDGALDPIQAAGVAASLQADPEKAKTVACYRAQNDLLKALYGPIADEELPPVFRALMDTARPRLRRAS